MDDPGDRTTAQEWLAAHRAEQLAEDPHREVRDETELTDQTITLDAGTRDDVAAAPVVETAVPDVRDTSVPDATEAADSAQQRRVPTVNVTAAD